MIEILVTLIILFLNGCHHNAHIRTQRQLSPSEAVFSGSITSFPIALVNEVDDWGNNPEASIGILGMRTELSFLFGLENYQELGAYAGLGLGSWASGKLYGLHYKRYQYIPLTNRLVKIGGGLEMNISERGKVFNSKTSITETSSEKYSSYKGVHFLFARSYENISHYDRGSQVYAAQGYGIQSIGIGMTLGHEKSVIKNTSSQIQFDGSIVYDSYNYGASAMYFLFSASIGMNLFLPPSYQKKSFTPLPPIRKKKTEPSINNLLNTSEELFDPETGEPIKKSRNIFDSEPDEIIEKDPTEYDPETGEIIE